MTGSWVDEPVRCMDLECPQAQPSAQPEADGDLRYYACPCGMEFGYEQAVPDAGACSLGIPEEVRSRASIPVARGKQPVFLGTIGRRPG